VERRSVRTRRLLRDPRAKGGNQPITRKRARNQEKSFPELETKQASTNIKATLEVKTVIKKTRKTAQKKRTKAWLSAFT